MGKGMYRDEKLAKNNEMFGTKPKKAKKGKKDKKGKKGKKDR